MQRDYTLIAEVILVVITFCIVASILIIIFTIYQRRFKFSKQLQYLEQTHQKNLLSAQLEIQEQTFNYIAREIHDHIGQRLTLARFYLNSRKENSKEKAEQLIDESSSLIEMAITDLKHLSRTLTADYIKDNGLFEAIKMEINHVNKINGFKAYLTVEGAAFFTDENTELLVFRIIQEALQNILKHAEAHRAEVKLTYQEDQLHVSVSDDGNGFDAATFFSTNKKSEHSGIMNMKNRVELYKGTFNIESSPGKGTAIFFTIPVKPLVSHE